MAIYLFSQVLKLTKYSIKLIEKLSRRNLINSSDVFVIKGFTVLTLCINDYSLKNVLNNLIKYSEKY